MKTKWPANRTVNIVCHGHSVPSGYFMTPVVDTFNSYPHLLHLALKKKYPFAVINVLVTAIGGENSIDGAKRFKKDVLALSPDAVTIDYSLNDRSLSFEKAAKAWTNMIKAAKAKKVKVILLSPTADLREDPRDKKTPLYLHSSQVRGLARKFNTGFVDSLGQYRKIAKAGGKINRYLSHMKHPNKKGHQLVAKELLKWF